MNASLDSALLVLGPPRSGKTTGVVIPNVLAWPGAVISTSIKTDVLEPTVTARNDLGQCWLFDPAGTSALSATADLGYTKLALPAVKRLRWSPTAGCSSWGVALRIANRMVRVAKAAQAVSDESFWSERAEALLAPMLHGADLEGLGMRDVAQWVRQRDGTTVSDILRDHARDAGTAIAADVLRGMLRANERELQSHWSTIDSALAAYRSPEALAMTDDVNFHCSEFPGSRDTIYITASGASQRHVAPVIVAFLEEIRESIFATDPRGRPRVLWALDELANIAPLPDLPSLASQAGGQGLTLLACLQDLSQARKLWQQEADGLLTLFRNKIVFGGIEDTDTLRRLSEIAGDHDVETETTSETHGQYGPSTSIQRSVRREPRLPISSIAADLPATALLFHGFGHDRVLLLPYYDWSPWRDLAAGPQFEPRLRAETARLGKAAETGVRARLARIAVAAGAPEDAGPVLYEAVTAGFIAPETQREVPVVVESLRAAGLLEAASHGALRLTSLFLLLLRMQHPGATAAAFLNDNAPIHRFLFDEEIQSLLRTDPRCTEVSPEAGEIVINIVTERRRHGVGLPRYATETLQAISKVARGEDPAAIDTMRAWLSEQKGSDKREASPERGSGARAFKKLFGR